MLLLGDGFHLTEAQGIIIVLAVLCGVLAWTWFNRGSQKLITLRKRSVQLGAFLNEVGLIESADFFEDFAVNDIDGMWESGEAMLKIANNPELRAAALAKVVDKYIAIALQNDPAEVTRLQGLLGGTAAAASSATLSSAQVQGLVSALAANATLPPLTAAGKTVVTHTPPPVTVQAPAIQTSVSHAVVAPAGTAVSGS